MPFRALLLAFGLASGPTTTVDAGRELAFATAKGNCVACHAIAGGRQMGDLGPPLSDMRTRFPLRRELFRRIWDESAYNPATLMPPFGRHGILTAHEIELIIDFLYTR
ncbi:MAG: sulfur oxidation c-type cytochrome SoxX [Gammaproteobacteria bacterium]